MSKCERFAHVAQGKWVNVSDLLRLLRTNERLGAHHSGCSWQMSKFDQFTQVDQDKWANERIALFFVCKSLIFSFAHKNDQLALKKFEKIVFLNIFYSFFKSCLKKQKFCSFLLNKLCESLRSLRTNEQLWANRSWHMSKCEQFAQVAQHKRTNRNLTNPWGKKW